MSRVKKYYQAGGLAKVNSKQLHEWLPVGCARKILASSASQDEKIKAIRLMKELRTETKRVRFTAPDFLIDGKPTCHTKGMSGCVYDGSTSHYFHQKLIDAFDERFIDAGAPSGWQVSYMQDVVGIIEEYCTGPVAKGSSIDCAKLLLYGGTDIDGKHVDGLLNIFGKIKF